MESMQCKNVAYDMFLLIFSDTCILLHPAHGDIRRVDFCVHELIILKCAGPTRKNKLLLAPRGPHVTVSYISEWVTVCWYMLILWQRLPTGATVFPTADVNGIPLINKRERGCVTALLSGASLPLTLTCVGLPLFFSVSGYCFPAGEFNDRTEL